MAYSISQDMQEIYDNPDKWVNHGRHALENKCKHKEGVSYSGWCEKCNISEDMATPIMNYLYPLELNNFDEDKILKVVKETNCTILENTDTGEYFLALCGGGMDLSQDIGLSYIILEKWIPQDLLTNLAKQPLLSLGSKNYKKLAREVIKQLKHNADNFKQKRKEWKESLKNLKIKESAESENNL